MPHQCTNCAREFDDGSKEMLSGCPDCGGNKFQFKPDGASESGDAAGEPAAPPEPPEPPEPSGAASVARTVGKTASTVRDLMGSSDTSEPSIGADQPDPIDPAPSTSAPPRENTAQASARTDVVTPDELPSKPATETEHRFRPVRSEDEAEADAESDTPSVEREETDTVATATTGAETASVSEQSSATGQSEDADRPDLDELRAELNDQFESIKVCSPGQYELNLMELYDRDEYIIALQEDGRYSIQVPENFRE